MIDDEPCPKCGRPADALVLEHGALKPVYESIKALQDQLNDWRQFGFAQCGPPISCDRDMIDGIEGQLRELRTKLALARKALAAAEEMRDSLTIESFALPRQCDNIAAFDAAMAEVRKAER